MFEKKTCKIKKINLIVFGLPKHYYQTKIIKTRLNKKEYYLANFVAKQLKQNNIFFAGVDLISHYLIGDINVTSPTGLKNFKNLSGINLAIDFWDSLEKLK